MTKEEQWKREAEKSFKKYRVTDIDYVVSPYSEDEGEKMLMFNREYDAEEEYFRLYSNGYLAGTETREKRIAELEKDKAYTEGQLDEQIQATLKLQKENAELIHENARLVTVIDKSKSWGISPLNALIINNLDAQLTKAKEHIKQLLDCLKQDTNDPQTNYYVCKYMDKAEQFLSEVEK